MASNQVEQDNICSICLDCVPVGEAVNVCSDKSHGPSCRDCIKSYIENQVKSAYLGTCPCISCPNLTHTLSKTTRSNEQTETEGAVPEGVGKKRKLLIFEEWKLMVPNNVHVKYTSLAQSILAFLCGGCHSLKSLDVGFDRTTASDYFAAFFRENPGDSSLPTSSVPPPPSLPSTASTTVTESTIPPLPPADASMKANLLAEDINRFCGGEMTVDDLFKKIFSFYIPQLVSIADQPAWDIFINVLKLIPDPERRANFHLRYLRDRPRMKTACCNREHCFKCRIKDYHEGKSCTENTESLDHSVVSCPSCGISLTKGDGCNTITCVCGKQFSWSAEKENSERCQQFLASFPSVTSAYCAVVLCTNFTHIRHPRNIYNLKNSASPAYGILSGEGSAVNSDISRTFRRNAPVSSAVITQAKAWQLRHRVEVCREMRNLFETIHWPSPSQCCSTLSAHLNPEYVREEGMREAADIWKQENVKAVAKCSSQNSIALQSLMTTFYSNDSERAIAAYKLLNLSRLVWKSSSAQHPSTPFAVDSRLADSAKQWVERNREVYNTFVEMYEVRSAQQFLHLYGARHPLFTRPSYTYVPSVSEWCRRTSNNDLTYTNDNTTVERVGSVSCYPAAFAPIIADHCSIKVVLDQASKTSNWISFGLARTGMASSSSDGVGRTSNTWGLSDDRSASSGNCILSASNQESGLFRKLVAGDILTATVILSEGLLEISVNDNELHHRFSIPPGNLDDYVFAMTFANDHRVSIVHDHGPTPVKVAAAQGETSSTNSTGEKDSKKGLLIAPQHVDLNYEQTQMMNILRKQLKSILTQINNEDSDGGSAMLLLDGAQNWEQLSGGTYEDAARNYQQISNEIEVLLNVRRSSTTAEKKDLSRLPWLTWNTIIWALSWYKENKERTQIEQNTILAQNFYCMYGEDAAFVAAMNLVEYHTHNVDSESQMASLAFMKVFESDMQSWYEYNASLSEPLIENLNKRCKCLPRHNKKCPKEGGEDKRKLTHNREVLPEYSPGPATPYTPSYPFSSTSPVYSPDAPIYSPYSQEYNPNRVNGPQMERRPRIPMITRLASLKRRYTSSTVELDEMEHHASPMMERPRNARMEPYTNMMDVDREFSYMDSATTEIFSGYEASLRSVDSPFRFVSRMSSPSFLTEGEGDTSLQYPSSITLPRLFSEQRDTSSIPSSPSYFLNSSAAYSPGTPASYRSTSPAYSPDSPIYSPPSHQISPNSPVDFPRSPVYSPMTSPTFRSSYRTAPPPDSVYSSTTAPPSDSNPMDPSI